MNKSLMECPTSGLILPRNFVDEKRALKKVIDDFIEKIVSDYQRVEGSYFVSFHAKFDNDVFKIDPPTISRTLPPFISNSLVWWVSNERGIKELLWMVSPRKKGEKLKVEFNKSGVAYLQAKGAMPS
jgi:hypothetical protein